VARSRRRWIVRLGLVVVAIAVAAGGGRVGAARAGLIGSTLGLDCPVSSQPFAPWGDYAKYIPITGGDFEGGAAGWTLTGGAAVVSGNEPFHVGGADDRRMLSLPSGSSATSAPTCIALLTPGLRFFATDPGTDGGLRARIIFRGLLGGVLGIADATTLPRQAAWGPTKPVLLGGTSLTVPLGTKTFQVQLTPIGSGSAWQVDDLYIDPFFCR
jgi:hypothetical protein